MKRIERQRLKILQDKYYNRMTKVNDNYSKFLKEADKFRMKCVEEIGKLLDQDKELQKLRKMDNDVYQKNLKKKQDDALEKEGEQ